MSTTSLTHRDASLNPNGLAASLAAAWSAGRGPLGTAALAGIGVTCVVAVWAAIAVFLAKDLPSPWATAEVLRELLRRPFYDAGPNDKGIAIQLLASLQRVATGFAVGTLIAVPIGLALGISPLLRRVIDPVLQVLRPVSPLAWFPIGLAITRSAPQALVFMIVITSLWPTLINTAFGTSTLPREHRDVARVFHFSRTKYLTRIVLPYSLPHILTGMRLSMGIAWMVIVAGEMLSGGTGIGFFVWDSWNALSLERVISAIVLIGLVGFALDRGFGRLASHFSYAEAA